MGRTLICGVFLAAALGASDLSPLAERIAGKTTITPAWVLTGATVLLLAGCLSVMVGYHARWGALVLLAFLALTTWFFHGFTLWSVVNPTARHDHFLALVKDLSIMGAMLMIVVNGSGAMSLDRKRG